MWLPNQRGLVNSESKGELSPYRLLTDPLPPHAPAPTGAAPHLWDYWRTIAKHRGAVAAVLIAFVGITAAYTFSKTPLYTATVTVQIDRRAPNVAPVEEVQRSTDSTDYDRYDYYQTQFRILASRTLAARSIRGLSLDTDVRFVGSQPTGLSRQIGEFVESLRSRLSGPCDTTADEGGLDSKLVDRYLKNLSILPVRNSRLVEVSFTSRFPDFSAEVANRHVEEFIGSAMEQRLETTGKAKEFLESELAKSRDRVVDAEMTLNDLRKKNGIVNIDGKGDIVGDRLADLNQRYTEAQSDRIKLQGQCDLIRQRSYESLPDVSASQLVQGLKHELTKTEAERAQLEGKFKPGYPKMREAMAREAQLRSRLNSEIRKIVATTQSTCMAARGREDELKRTLDEQREVTLAEKDVTAEYTTLARDVEAARTVYATLLQRTKDVDIAQEIRLSNISVVDHALPPRSPSRPRKGLNLTIGLIGGLLAGLGLAFFLEYLDDTVKTPEDVQVRLGLPMLGVVPHFDSKTRTRASRISLGRKNGSAEHSSEKPGAVALVADAKNRTTQELMVAHQPLSIATEAYRMVRTAILLSAADEPPQVILVTSGVTGEGKTVTAINEALTLVQAGGKVLLFDADIRRPRLHKVFNLPNGHGLSTFLAGQSSFESIVHEVAAVRSEGTNGNGKGHLFVVPAGPTPPNPAELLGGKRMKQVIEALRKEYDYILFDTPPVLPVADTEELSRVSDGVVLVVHGQRTPIKVVGQCRDRLQRVRAPILGVVLNNIDPESQDYSDYYPYSLSYYGDVQRG
ncbi:MAG: GumC family protein [Candidatus Binatia bacterium]